MCLVHRRLGSSSHPFLPSLPRPPPISHRSCPSPFGRRRALHFTQATSQSPFPSHRPRLVQGPSCLSSPPKGPPSHSEHRPPPATFDGRLSPRAECPGPSTGIMSFRAYLPRWLLDVMCCPWETGSATCREHFICGECRRTFAFCSAFSRAHVMIGDRHRPMGWMPTDGPRCFA